MQNLCLFALYFFSNLEAGVRPSEIPYITRHVPSLSYMTTSSSHLRRCAICAEEPSNQYLFSTQDVGWPSSAQVGTCWPAREVARGTRAYITIIARCRRHCENSFGIAPVVQWYCNSHWFAELRDSWSRAKELKATSFTWCVMRRAWVLLVRALYVQKRNSVHVYPILLSERSSHCCSAGCWALTCRAARARRRLHKQRVSPTWIQLRLDKGCSFRGVDQQQCLLSWSLFQI